MRTVGLTWQHAWAVAGVLAIIGGVMATSASRRLRSVGAFLREAAVIGILYGLWQLAGRISVRDILGAFNRARWIEGFEHDVFLPSEQSVQHAFLGHHLVIQAANLYYAGMHLPMMLTFLVWLFIWHREEYRPVRQVMAWTSLACLVVQLLPVAPPRMLPGIVDTAALYGQSVYTNGLPIDQLSAMPSLHVAWAVLVGYYAWRIGSSRWRYLGPIHAVITIFVVVVTGNHWWLDGIVGVAILAACAWAVFGVRTAWRSVASRRRPGRVGQIEGVLVPEG